MAELTCRAVRDAAPDRDVLLVGESIGGTVAIAVGARDDCGPVRAVLAFDPPMTTRKLWTWRKDDLEHRRNALAQDPKLLSFFRDALGLQFDRVDENIYYDLLGNLKIPTTIAAGDATVLSQKESPNPAMFDTVDVFVVEQFYADKVRLRSVDGAGHVVLFDAPAACVEIIKESLHDHVSGGTPRI